LAIAAGLSLLEGQTAPYGSGEIKERIDTSCWLDRSARWHLPLFSTQAHG